MEHRDTFILDVIIEYCGQIMNSVSGMSYDEFVGNLDVKDACALRVLQIGENVGNLSDGFRMKNAQISWGEIMGLRNIIAHEYGNVDNEVLWEIVTEDIPVLKKECEIIIK